MKKENKPDKPFLDGTRPVSITESFELADGNWLEIFGGSWRVSVKPREAIKRLEKKIKKNE